MLTTIKNAVDFVSKFVYVQITLSNYDKSRNTQMATIKLQVPTIHLNGSSPVTLQEDIRDAAHAVSLAVDAMTKTAPHMRDFYVRQDGGLADFNLATNEHRNRLRTLNRLYAELVALNEGIEGRVNEVELEIGE